MYVKFANAAKLSLLCLALLLLAATAALAESAKVKVMEKEGLGKYITDAKGMTLYAFDKDTPGKSACAGDCLQKWPAFSADKIEPEGGLAAADFGTIKRDDGAPQTTYKGYPLYYFFKDKAAGDTNGQGLMSVWRVIDPAKFPAK